MKLKKLIMPTMLATAFLGTAVILGTSVSNVYASDTTTTTATTTTKEVGKYEGLLKDTKSKIDYNNYRLDFDYLTSEDAVEDFKEILADSDFIGLSTLISDGYHVYQIKISDSIEISYYENIDSILTGEEYESLSSKIIYSSKDKENNLDNYSEYKFELHNYSALYMLDLPFELGDALFICSDPVMAVNISTGSSYEIKEKEVDNTLYELYKYAEEPTTEEEYKALYENVMLLESINEKFFNSIPWFETFMDDVNEWVDTNYDKLMLSAVSLTALVGLLGLGAFLLKKKRC